MIKHKSLGCAIALSCLLLTACSSGVASSPHHQASVMRQHITYTESSEKKPYPKSVKPNDRIIVSEAKQRAYLQEPTAKEYGPGTPGKNGHYRTIYEFYVSTGKNVNGRRTPKGVYHINGVHSKWFYSPTEHEGAHNGIGFHDGGVYLFHETPSHQNGTVIKSVAKELGKKGTSYGCVHLTRPDSEWFYTHIPTGLKVIIK